MRSIAAAVVVGALAAGCGGGSVDTARFCELATDEDRTRGVFDDFDPDRVDEALDTLRAARDTQRQIRAVAPGAVRADLDLVIDYVEDLIAGLGRSDDASDGRPAIYQELLPRIGEVTAASERLDRFVTEVCVSGSTTEPIVVSSTPNDG